MKNHEGKMCYEHVGEVFAALEPIEGVDLTSKDTTVEMALPFCKEVMKVISRCEYLQFKRQDAYKLSEILKAKGACAYKKANPELLSVKGGVGVLMGLKNNVQFPLSAFTQIVDASYETFTFGMSMLTEGGEHSWCDIWLKNQGIQMKEPDQGME